MIRKLVKNLVVILGLATVCSSQLQAVEWDVNSTLDNPWTGNPSLPDSTAGAGIVTLRSVIQFVNGPSVYNPAVDIIGFRITGTGPFKIAPSLSPLPTITNKIVLNGYLQPGAVAATATTPAVIMIELSGENIDYINVSRNNDFGLVLGAGSSGSTIQGLAINRFPGLPFTGSGANPTTRPGAGILILSANNSINGNFIGTTVDGLGTGDPLNNRANGQGIEIRGAGATGNTIGGTAAAQRNVIGGSLYLMGSISLLSGAQSNTISGNFIGVNKNGTGVIGNTQIGVLFTGAVSNTLGGSSSSARNIISGASIAQVAVMPLFFSSLQLSSTTNTIQGNFIGLDSSGNNSLSEPISLGVYVTSSNGLTISNNVISGLAWGINAITSTFVATFTNFPRQNYTISANIIGLNASGTAAVPNQVGGMYLQGLETSTVSNNTISANNGDGILIVQDVIGNIFKGNLIGLDPTGIIAFPNLGDGIRIGNVSKVNPNGNIFGGPNDADRNIIASNEGNGVEIKSGAFNNTLNNNYIGTSITGDLLFRPNADDFSNGKNGVLIVDATDNLILANLIQNNEKDGILLCHDANSNIIQKNTIQANHKSGIEIIDSSCNLIGANDDVVCSADCGELQNGNLIKDNHEYGVAVRECSLEADDNAILANSIYNNKHRGILLDSDGSSEDPNNLQASPRLHKAKNSDGLTIISGKLVDTFSSTEYLIEFFSNSHKRNEGKTFIGKIVVGTDEKGNGSFEAILPCAKHGTYVTATATRLVNWQPTDTSEFSNSVKVH